MASGLRKTLFISVILLLAVAALHADEGDRKAVDDYNFAVWLYNSGKHGLAAESYAGFLGNYPKHERAADARFGLAQSLFHTDKFQQAAEEYEKVRAEFPGFAQGAELLFQLAQTYVALNRFADAESLFREVRDKHAGHYLADWAAARQAACLISMGKSREAGELLDKFVEKYAPGDTPPEKCAATKEMLQKLEKAGIEADDSFLGLIERSLFYQALARFNQGRFGDSRKSFEGFRKRYPGSSLSDEAQFRFAQSCYRLEAYFQAAEAYETVAGGQGEFAAPAGFERGLALYKSGKLKEASAAFAKMAERFPQNPQAPQARLYSGTFLYESGDFKGAMAILDPIARAGKDNADEAAYWTGMCLIKLGDNAKAGKAFDAAIAAFPQSPLLGDMRLGLADSLLAQDLFVQAADAFRRYAKDFEKGDQAPRALFSACAALHRADKYPESDELCAEFLDRHGKHELAPQALFLSGENRFLLKRYDKAGDRYLEYLGRGDKAADRVARAHYRMAWVAHYAKKNEDAVAELRKIDPKAAGGVIAVEMKYLEGVCLFELGKFAEAAKALDAYLDAGDHSRFGDDALLKAAVSQMKQNKKAQAASILERFVKEYPKSELLPQVQYQLGECYFDQKAYGQAVASYRLAAGHEPPGELTPYAMFGIALCWYDQEKWAEAAKAFGDMAEKFPKSDLAAHALYRRAKSFMKLGNWGDAEKTFRALPAAFPKHELSRASAIAAGSCLQEMKKWADAAAAFKSADADYPAGDDQARVLYEQAWSWRQAEKDEESLAVFRRLADRFPADPLAADAFFYLAEAEYKAASGSPENPKQPPERLLSALALYRKVLEVAKDNRLADKTFYRMGWCYWLTGDYAKAAEEFGRLVRDFPGSELFADAAFQAGQSSAKAGKPAEAVEWFTKLIGDKRSASFEFLPDAYLGLGNCLIILDKPDEAIKPLETALDRFKEDRVAIRAHFMLGKARFNLRKYEEAIRHFTEVTARTKTETGAEAQFFIGQALHSQNDVKGAIMAYLRVIALYRDQPEWVAGAMFEMAKCQEVLGEKAQARKTLEDIVKNYKNTKWAKLAGERL